MAYDRVRMPYINEDIPLKKYYENRKMGRSAIPSKRYYYKSLTISTSFFLSPKMKKGIDKLVEKEIFPNKAEFFRYLIIKFFEENKEWLK